MKINQNTPPPPPPTQPANNLSCLEERKISLNSLALADIHQGTNLWCSKGNVLFSHHNLQFLRYGNHILKIYWHRKLFLQKKDHSSEGDPCSYEATKSVGQKAQKKIWGFKGIQTHDLCDTGAMLYRLSYEALLGVGQEWVQFIPVIWREWNDVYMYMT